MRLKVYHAPNIGAAMAMVREELGPDALILANKSVDGGVELTAAHEQPSTETKAPEAAMVPASVLQLRPTPITPAIPLAATDLARAGTLRWHGVPVELEALLARGDLARGIEAALTFGTIPCGIGDPPLLLTGPPGAGKTLTTARIATRLKLSGRSSMVITTDGRRAGAAEQLAAFTRLLGLTLIVADTPKQLARAIERRVDGEPVLVDMPGLNPTDPEDRAYLRDCQAVVNANAALVLPAGLDPAEAADMAQDFMELGVTSLIATRLDQSRRLGGLLAAAHTGLILTEAGVSPAVADGLIRITPSFLAERLSYARPKLSGASEAGSLPFLAQAFGKQPRSEP